MLATAAPTQAAIFRHVHHAWFKERLKVIAGLPMMLYMLWWYMLAEAGSGSQQGQMQPDVAGSATHKLQMAADCCKHGHPAPRRTEVGVPAC